MAKNGRKDFSGQNLDLHLEVKTRLDRFKVFNSIDSY